jgi:transposase
MTCALLGEVYASTLLKLYIYGYLNRIQASPRLERESRRNLELIWLIGRLSPDFKTIADFRGDNGPAIKKVCAQLIVICKNIGMFNNSAVSVDHSHVVPELM